MIVLRLQQLEAANSALQRNFHPPLRVPPSDIPESFPMPQRIRTPRIFPAVILAAIFTYAAATSFAQSSGGSIELHANTHIPAADIGLPTYPGASLYKDSDNDSAVDMGFTFGDVHFKLLAANYTTPASPAQVLAFSRKPLSRYGEVLECDHGKPVGS